METSEQYLVSAFVQEQTTALPSLKVLNDLALKQQCFTNALLESLNDCQARMNTLKKQNSQLMRKAKKISQTLNEELNKQIALFKSHQKELSKFLVQENLSAKKPAKQQCCQTQIQRNATVKDVLYSSQTKLSSPTEEDEIFACLSCLKCRDLSHEELLRVMFSQFSQLQEHCSQLHNVSLRGQLNQSKHQKIRKKYRRNFVFFTVTHIMFRGQVLMRVHRPNLYNILKIFNRVLRGQLKSLYICGCCEKEGSKNPGIFFTAQKFAQHSKINRCYKKNYNIPDSHIVSKMNCQLIQNEQFNKDRTKYERIVFDNVYRMLRGTSGFIKFGNYQHGIFTGYLIRNKCLAPSYMLSKMAQPLREKIENQIVNLLCFCFFCHKTFRSNYNLKQHFLTCPKHKYPMYSFKELKNKFLTYEVKEEFTKVLEQYKDLSLEKALKLSFEQSAFQSLYRCGICDETAQTSYFFHDYFYLQHINDHKQWSPNHSHYVIGYDWNKQQLSCHQ